MVLASASLLGAVTPAGAMSRTPAQITDWHITDYHVDLAVQKDGAVNVKEVIAVDFSGSPHHGIDRYIQTRYRYDSVKKDYDRLTPIDQVKVTGSAGTPANFERKQDGDQTWLRIGDKDKTISGPHTYTVSYRIRGVLNHFQDHDELYWNVVGDKWAVPIDHADASLTVPGPVNKTTCFAGPSGSTLPCSNNTTSGQTASFAQTGLAAYTGFTIVAGLKVGAVSPTPEPILEQRWTFQRAFALRPDTLAPTGGMVAVLVGGFAFLALRKGRDEQFVGGAADQSFGNDSNAVERVPVFGRDPIPVEYVPPDDLRPGQVGTLIDEQANTLDVTATIIDLAVRGYLKITEIPKQGLFGHTDWTLTRLANNDRLKQYERTLITGLFKSGGEIELSDLKNHFHTTLVKVEDQLYDDTVKQGWFSTRPDSTRNHWKGIAIGVMVAGVALTVALARFTSYGLLGLPLAVAGLLVFFGSSRFPRRTAKGHASYRRILGFKQFIDESEKDRAQFAERQNLFSEYLPYAVASVPPRSGPAPLPASTGSCRRRPGTSAHTPSPWSPSGWP